MSNRPIEKRPRDIRFDPFPEVEWAQGLIGNSLEQVSSWSLDQAGAAADWYLTRKKGKRLGARLSRCSAILLVVVAGLVPLVGDVWTIDGRPGVNPLWASIAVVLAAGAVGIDRFFGFSSAYMRYLAAAMKLQRMTQNFSIEWQARRAAFGGTDPRPEQVQEAFDACKQFLTEVAQAVEAETQNWIQDFTAALADTDKNTRIQSDTARTAAINLTVTNADQSENGWQLAIDNGSPEMRLGKTAAVRDLVPGTHSIRVRGQIDGTTKSAERSVVATAGTVAELDLTLA